MALGFVVAIGIWIWLARRQEELRTSYAASLRDQLAAGGVCRIPQLDALDQADGRLAGRSVALTVDRGQPKLTKADEALDRDLLAVYQRKLALYQQAFHALVLDQEQRRESLEKLSRAGQRMWTERERKTAAWADGLLQDRVQAADDLAASLKQLGDDTAELAAALTGVLARPSEKAAADRLQRFHFKADLRAARTACEQRSAKAGTALAGALTALSE